MNKKQIKADFKRLKKELKLNFKNGKTKRKYAYRAKKEELLYKKKTAEKGNKISIKKALKAAKRDYKKEAFLQKSIYLEKLNILKKKKRDQLDSVVKIVTERVPESLSGNLTLSYVLIFFGFALLQSLLVIIATGYTIDKRATDSLTTVANTLKAGQLQQELAKAVAEENDMNIALYTEDGTPVYSYGMEDFSEHLPYNRTYEKPFSFRYQTENFLIYTVREDGYSLNLAKSMNAENAFLSIVVNIMLISAVLVLTISYFVGYRTARSLLRPIGVLSRAMNEVSSADLSARLSTDNIRTELREVVDSYNRMLDKIEDAYLRQKQFVSDASHELRTPLAIISGYSDILSRWGAEDPVIRQEALDAIVTQSANMQTLLERLLYITRSENGSLQLELSENALSPVCKEVLQDFKTIHPEKQFSLSGEAKGVCDPHLVRQLLTILLDNAVKFTAKQGRISIDLSEDETHAYLAITDNGTGMSEEIAAHIFERFYKGDSSHNEKGFGLGLSIAKLITESQGGTISVLSSLGKGSTFSIKFKK
ncbi:MAG: HAMP domain-containing histidine kinase [Clostridia bacterium]|nr:HAMP domain-containing histidine kinase [Clostridia bacterium]